MRRIHFLKLYLVPALFLLPRATGAQQLVVEAEAPVIRVTGEAQSTSNPDLLQLQVAVVTRDPSAQNASSENARVVAAVLQSLRSVLGAGSSVTTVDYSLGPDYSQVRDQAEMRPTGYVARNSLRVETADLNKAGALIDAAIAAGANDIGGVLYTLRDQSKLRADALAQAARDARAKAETLAQAMGIRLGSVRKMEDTYSMPGPMYDARAELAAGNPATPIVNGPVRLRAVVTVTFDIAR